MSQSRSVEVIRDPATEGIRRCCLRALMALLTSWGVGPDPLEDRKAVSDRAERRRAKRALGWPTRSAGYYHRDYPADRAARRRRECNRLERLAA